MSKLVWKAIHYNRIKKKIEEFNLFDDVNFLKTVKKDLKECKSKELFAERLQSNLLYYYWGKVEWEIVIMPWENSSPEEQMRVDVYWQVMNNWDVFLDYVWNSKKTE